MTNNALPRVQVRPKYAHVRSGYVYEVAAAVHGLGAIAQTSTRCNLQGCAASLPAAGRSGRALRYFLLFFLLRAFALAFAFMRRSYRLIVADAPAVPPPTRGVDAGAPLSSL